MSWCLKNRDLDDCGWKSDWKYYKEFSCPRIGHLWFSLPVLRCSKVLERDFGWLWWKSDWKYYKEIAHHIGTRDSTIFENRVCYVKTFEGLGTRFRMIVSKKTTKSITKRSLSCPRFGHLWKSRAVLRRSKVRGRDSGRERRGMKALKVLVEIRWSRGTLRSIWACKGLARSTLRVGLQWFRKLDEDVQTAVIPNCGEIAAR